MPVIGSRLRRLEQLVGLAQDASLGGPEHEVEGDGREGPGEQRDEHDLSTELIEVAEDRRRVPPDPDDRDDLAVDLDREVRAQDVVGGQGRADRLGIGDRVEPGRDRSVGRGGEVGRQSPARCPPGSPASDRRIVPSASRTSMRRISSGGVDRPELRLEGGGARRGQAAGLEVGRRRDSR